MTLSFELDIKICIPDFYIHVFPAFKVGIIFDNIIYSKITLLRICGYSI
jgi:hypothetical protein